MSKIREKIQNKKKEKTLKILRKNINRKNKKNLDLVFSSYRKKIFNLEKQIEHFQEKCLIDDLTGLYNKRK